MRSASSPASRSHPGEDALKAFGAAAASSGAVGLFHIAGVTPEAPDAETALGGVAARNGHPRDAGDGRDARARPFDGGEAEPHRCGGDRQPASVAGRIRRAGAADRRAAAARADLCLHRPPCACASWNRDGRRKALEASGVIIVADTCVVVTPILPDLAGGVLMTNSGKFAQYAPGNTGYAVLYGSLADCVESAVAGKPVFTEIAA